MGLADWIAPPEATEVLPTPPVAVAVPAVPAVEVRAVGYGCGKCQANNYLQVDGGWRCEGCGMVFEVIGGSKGPYLLTGPVLGYAKGASYAE